MMRETNLPDGRSLISYGPSLPEEVLMAAIKNPCSRCSYASVPMEPRLVSLGWQPGLVMSLAYKIWLKDGTQGVVPDGPAYVPCPNCGEI